MCIVDTLIAAGAVYCGAVHATDCHSRILIAALALLFLVFRPLLAKTNLVRAAPHGAAGEQESATYRSVVSPNDLVSTIYGCGTIPAMFAASVEKYGSAPYLGERTQLSMTKKKVTVEKNGEMIEKLYDIPVMSEYVFESYEQIGDKVQRFGAGLVKCAPVLTPRSKVAIFANTRKEWQVAAQGCYSQNLTIVTVYATLGPAALKHALDETKVSTVITEASLVKNLLANAAALPSLTNVVYMDSLDEADLAAFASDHPSIRFHSYDDVMTAGAAKTACTDPAVPEDLAVIMYTSGSTGNPKGVMVTHRNIISACEALRIGCGAELFRPDDTYIAYLPLAHIMEMEAEIIFSSQGGRIGYATPRTLTSDGCYNEQMQPCGDISALRPTLMAAVPAVLDKMRSGISNKIAKAPLPIRLLWKAAYYMKRRAVIEGGSGSFWNKLIFKKVAAVFGGRLRFIISGGAPLSFETQEFMNVVLSVPVLQGYGLTETCAGGTIGHPDDIHPGTVGGPVPCCEMKVVDVPDMGYRATDQPLPRGEIYFRGNNIVKGYYQLPGKTDECFLDCKDGGGRWFASGDIGQIHPTGVFQIIDRKKDLVKLQKGEYVALGKLEAVYRNSPLIDNICVYACSTQNFPIAVIVPNTEACVALARSLDIDADTDDEQAALASNPAIIKAFNASMLAEAKKAHFVSFERIGKFKIVNDEWTPESGLQTAAMKLKRNNINKKYAQDYAQMYK